MAFLGGWKRHLKRSRLANVRRMREAIVALIKLTVIPMRNLYMDVPSTEEGSLFKQAHVDLTRRARGGIGIYFLVWVFCCIWLDVYQSAPVFVVLNTVIILMFSVLRIGHDALLRYHPESNSLLSYYCLVVFILGGALHWGVLSAFVIFDPDIHLMRFPVMIVMSALVVGGSAVLCISRLISICYPWLVFLPTLLVGLAYGDSMTWLFIALVAFSVAYGQESSRISHKDYWSALKNRQLAEMHARVMERLSVTDALTGLSNRSYFNNVLAQQWQHCRRERLNLCVFMIDLDHFKRINDTYGHAAGDRCLQEVAGVLKQQLNYVDHTVARYGGEEFIVLMPNLSLTDACSLADKLITAVAVMPLICGKDVVPMSCSIGVATVQPSEFNSAQALVDSADKALYKAKAAGRNCYKVA